MYSWAKNYIGIPFVSGGRTRAGCDCYGLVRLVLEEVYGYCLPVLNADYTDALDIEQSKRLFMLNAPLLCGEKISDPEEKAVALIRMKGRLCHVGLYAGGGFILHERHRLGSVCERIESPRLSGCVEGWYRVNPGYSAAESFQRGENRILF